MLCKNFPRSGCGESGSAIIKSALRGFGGQRRVEKERPPGEKPLKRMSFCFNGTIKEVLHPAGDSQRGAGERPTLSAGCTTPA